MNVDNNDELPGGQQDCGQCGRPCRCDGPRGKLRCFNWLDDIPGGMADSEFVEVQFKNTRKGYFRNSTNLPLEVGDIVAVEASPGHDIGEVTLLGQLVRLQMRKAGVKNESDLKRVFRKAKPVDIDKYNEARARENDTMIRARKIASDLNLNMKIGDVEYQGDGNKAIFYYIADERVDFRQLIKVLADTFKIRVEMKQIGARQEAGRIGGIGPCGRPLCCSSWMTNFVSVGTAAARYQDISLNPQKLAGQCAKLKCCLNFEVDAYVESIKKLPAKEVRLETADNTYYHFKFDVFRGEITYSTDKSVAANLVTIDAERAFEVMAMNKRGEKPLSLLRDEDAREAEKKQYNDILGQDITRFDKKKKNKRNRQRGDKQRSEHQPKNGETISSEPSTEPRENLHHERRPKSQESGEVKGQNDRKQNSEKSERSNRGERQRNRGERQRNRQRLRPGDTPDNAAPDSGRNAHHELPPALPPSQRINND